VPGSASASRDASAAAAAAAGSRVMSQHSNHPAAAHDAPVASGAPSVPGATVAVSAARRPDPEALATFAIQFRAAFRTLWTIAAGIVNDQATAEDVVQEAALTALSKLHEFEPNTNFTAWMAKIVRFIALNQSRRGRRQPASLDPTAMDETLPGRASGATSPHALDAAGGLGFVDRLGRLNPERSPFDDRLMRALGSVGEVARACLLLRTIEGLNYDEISQVLQIPPGTAMSHVHRTRMILRERLADLDPKTGAAPEAPTTAPPSKRYEKEVPRPPKPPEGGRT
jgi:RNA polymerase sigma-70 factor, ECF subfamily